MQQEKSEKPFKISAGQQMIASCSGAILTSLFGKIDFGDANSVDASQFVCFFKRIQSRSGN